MGLIPRETQSNINQALEKQNEQIPEVRTAEWYDDHNE